MSQQWQRSQACRQFPQDLVMEQRRELKASLTVKVTGTGPQFTRGARVGPHSTVGPVRKQMRHA